MLRFAQEVAFLRGKKKYFVNCQTIKFNVQWFAVDITIPPNNHLT